jgi:hypothetical protein
MRCYRFQKFRHAHQRHVAHLVCGNCGGSGRGEQTSQHTPPCELEHARPAAGCVSSSSRGKPYRNFGSRTVFPSWMPERSSLRTNPRPGPSGPLGVVAGTQTIALLNRGGASVAPQPAVSTQLDVCTRTEDFPASTAPSYEATAASTVRPRYQTASQ